MLKRIIADRGQDLNFPRDVIETAYASHLIANEAGWLQMLRDRNLTSHTYNRALADEIFARLTAHAVLLGTLRNK